MPRRPAMSKAEIQIARIVWELANATVRQVHQRFNEERPAEFKTVQTYLRRLEAKGYLRSRIDKGSRIYAPRARPSRVIGEVVDDFLDRLFGGDPAQLLHHLVEEGRVTREDIGRLNELLQKLEANENGP